MNSIAVAPQPEGQKLPAPRWHTGLVIAILLIPHAWWPGYQNLLGFLPHNSGVGDILGMFWYTFYVALVCWALSLNNTPLETLFGKMWTNRESALRDVMIGAAFWFTARYVARLVYFLLQAHPEKRRLLPQNLRELAIAVLLALMAGIAEELVFRGYLQKQLTMASGSLTTALLIQAVLFGLFHKYQQTFATLVRHCVFGLLAGLLAHWRKSLIPGMIGHAMLDMYAEIATFFR